MDYTYNTPFWGFMLLYIVLILHGVDAFHNSFCCIPWRYTRASVTRLQSLEGRTSFLASKNADTYSNQALRISVEQSKILLAQNSKLIEIEFPPSLSNDVSVTETLDSSRKFTREFIKSLSEYKKSLWVCFPDKKEAKLARDCWGEIPNTLTSIDVAFSPPADCEPPKCIVAVTPGFNVDEWIRLASIGQRYSDVPIIFINGNLDRLRNGYYPPLFYPGITAVTKSYYVNAQQALFLSPVAVGGDRFGAWLTKTASGSWELFVKSRDKKGDFDLISTSDKEPNPQSAWREAKKQYQQNFGGF